MHIPAGHQDGLGEQISINTFIFSVKNKIKLLNYISDMLKSSNIWYWWRALEVI